MYIYTGIYTYIYVFYIYISIFYIYSSQNVCAFVCLLFARYRKLLFHSTELKFCTHIKFKPRKILKKTGWVA